MVRGNPRPMTHRGAPETRVITWGMPLRGTEQRFRLITETISEVFWMAAADMSRLLYVSPTYERVWGRTCESIYKNPRSFLDAIHPGDLTLVQHHLERMREGLPLNHEYRIVRQDGTVRWIWDRGFPVRDEETSTDCYVGVAQDISERKRAEADATAMAERFLLMSRATTDAVWDWDIAGNTAWWNDCWYEKFQYDRAVTPSYAAWAERLHPADHDRVLADFTRAIESGASSWSAEYRFVLPDGTVKDVFDRGYVLRTSDGKPLRMVGAVMDITERRSLEAQLRQSQKMEAIGQLAGGVAHDFNNILQAMQLEIALAQETPGLPASVVSPFEQLRTFTDRAASLTRQLLLFSRREAMKLRWLDVNSAVTEVARLLHRILGEDIALHIDLGRGVLGAQADPGMLSQVLLNLAVNARDAMPRGGTLSIATAVIAREVCISVNDTGTGIAPEVVPRIFEPFFTTKDVGRGTGLGLATAFGIIEQHSGRITVQSEVGQGTLMRVYLPLAQGAPGPVIEIAAPKVHGGTETILLVEDDTTVRCLMRAVLERHGYRVLEAQHALDAMRAWDDADGRIDLLLTDVVMPGGIDGIELAARLGERSSGLKVMFASGHGPERVGLGVLLNKPVSLEHLLSAVRERLDAD